MCVEWMKAILRQTRREAYPLLGITLDVASSGNKQMEPILHKEETDDKQNNRAVT